MSKTVLKTKVRKEYGFLGFFSLFGQIEIVVFEKKIDSFSLGFLLFEKFQSLLCGHGTKEQSHNVCRYYLLHFDYFPKELRMQLLELVSVFSFEVQHLKS